MGLQDHVVALFLVFWETSILFSLLIIPIYIPTNSMGGFLFFHTLKPTGFPKHYYRNIQKAKSDFSSVKKPCFLCVHNYVVWMFSSVQSLSRVLFFVTPWTAACQASLSTTNSQSLPKLMSIESVMPSNHLILCHPLLLLPSIFPSIRVFSNELALCIRWPKYWSFSFNISPSNEYSGWISFRTD